MGLLAEEHRRLGLRRRWIGDYPNAYEQRINKEKC